MDKKFAELSFEEIMKQNERRVHYHIHRLNVRDPHKEFYQEGLVAMWNAYEKYEPDKGPLATYFNYSIRNRMIDLMRKKARALRNDEVFIEEEKKKMDNGNRSCKDRLPLLDFSDIPVDDRSVWKHVRERLTDNQWKWVASFIILELPLKEIARREGVTVEAVKSWGKQARKKLRDAKLKEKLLVLVEGA
ncbi:sigma-70 family RNA polymerase sigma factor [Virgibacillus alimentarius]|uniref:sigma-70 family RNA polymerase sigma factor n=1 Tax=Virgibacillus alimentarius TaxID=698769 RepID=UPI0004936F70|nr:sigma-70 family RNA polymerase sigma factor [Virgibacillus alimentarius]